MTETRHAAISAITALQACRCAADACILAEFPPGSFVTHLGRPAKVVGHGKVSDAAPMVELSFDGGPAVKVAAAVLLSEASH